MRYRGDFLEYKERFNESKSNVVKVGIGSVELQFESERKNKLYIIFHLINS